MTGSGLVVFDSNRWLLPGPITSPFDVAGNHVLRALQLLEADDRCSVILWLTMLQATVRELVGLLSRVTACLTCLTRVAIVTPSQGFGMSAGNSAGGNR